MTHELKPCPFCGSTNLITENARDFIACGDCATEGPWVCGQGSTESIEAWNRRAAPSVPSGEPAGIEDEPDALTIAYMMGAASAKRAPQPAPAGWRPIETAPKSALMGQILTYRHNSPNWTKGGGGGPHFQTSFWSARHELWVGWPLNIQPTHWMPLPAAPAAPGGEAGPNVAGNRTVAACRNGSG
jgi:Lar family restriction alleviation protein